MSEERDEPVASTAAKFSRYRSVRQQRIPRAEPALPPPPVPLSEQDPDLSRTKSMARYRRPRAATKTEATQSTPPPPMPTVPLPSRTQTSASRPATARDPTRRATEPVPPPQPIPETRPKETDRERLRRKAQEYRDREEAACKLDEQEAREKVEEEDELARRKEEEAARRLAEQKLKDLERLEAQLEAAGPTIPAPAREAIATPGKEKFSLFSRKRSATQTNHSSNMDSGSANSVARTRSIEAPVGIVEGGGGIVPQKDAPISASNAGERRVLIRCKQSSINLPVTPETTPTDIIFSAANIMSQNITPSTAILCESYALLGLERRIRRYEHVRDVMNSWDRDTQNALFLQNSDSPINDRDLETSAVPKEAPPDITVYMYHSQKPGKWNKRFITLLSTGQMHISKKPQAKAADISNICHLSDFDIYTSTPQYIRKSLKPPKKHCYAVKSQQKPTMFLSTENFVHYFSTDDEALAKKWYFAVQRWRSWYLVNRLGEGAKKSTKTTKVAKTATNHTVKLSMDESPYTIGTFSPLMDMNRFNNPPSPPRNKNRISSHDDGNDSEDENQTLQIPFHLRNSPQPHQQQKRNNAHPPTSYKAPRQLQQESEEFSSSGLLGRTYSQRQKAQAAREAENNSPFTNAPDALLNRSAGSPAGSGHQRTLSMKSTRRPTVTSSEIPPGLGRGKPLLDFTPHFKEAPQWDKSKKGRGVRMEGGGPLVEGATTYEAAEMQGRFRPEGDGNVFRREQIRPRTTGRDAGPFVEGGLLARMA